MRKTILVLLLSLLAAACSSTGTTTAPGAAGTGAPSSDLNATDQTATAPASGPGSQKDLTASAGDHVLFVTNRSDLTPEARAILKRQAAWLKRYPNVAVTIAGHADERGTREYNLALGDRRAAAVRSYLVSLGIPADRIGTVSYGKERPAVTGNGEKAWAQNRRAVTAVN
jgi:peptidoglycan-associated lipoprotein